MPRETIAVIWEQKAQIALQLGNRDLAVRCFENAVKGGRDTWEVRKQLGLVLYELGRKKEALESFLLSMKDKETSQVMLYASRCHRDLDNSDEALRLLELALNDMSGLTASEQCEAHKDAGYLYFAAYVLVRGSGPFRRITAAVHRLRGTATRRVIQPPRQPDHHPPSAGRRAILWIGKQRPSLCRSRRWRITQIHPQPWTTSAPPRNIRTVAPIS